MGESMTEDGERRHIVARGTHLNRPLSIDVFESHMFWASEGSGGHGGEVMQMDKFGRGVPRRRRGASRRRRQYWRPVLSPTRPLQRLSGTESSIQRPSTRGRTPSASWPKTTRSASTSLVGGCRKWSFSSSDIFVIFHSMDDIDSPSELLRVFLYILHVI